MPIPIGPLAGLSFGCAVGFGLMMATFTTTTVVTLPPTSEVSQTLPRPHGRDVLSIDNPGGSITFEPATGDQIVVRAKNLGSRAIDLRLTDTYNHDSPRVTVAYDLAVKDPPGVDLVVQVPRAWRAWITARAGGAITKTGVMAASFETPGCLCSSLLAGPETQP